MQGNLSRDGFLPLSHQLLYVLGDRTACKRDVFDATSYNITEYNNSER